MRALARNSLTSRMLWKRGTDLRRCGLLARGMTQCAAQCRAHERQLLNADALININHTKLSCCSSMLLAAATLGNSCPPSRLVLTMPPNLVSWALSRPQIAYSSPRRVLQVWRGLSSLSSSSFVRDSRDISVRDISCPRFQRRSPSDKYLASVVDTLD